jgi:hypothetical protein
VGLDAVERHAASIRAAVPDLRLEHSGRPLGDSDYACIPWRMAGTHTETNRFLTLHGVHYAELVDGRVRRARGFFDLYAAATQLGYLPARGGIGEALVMMLRGFGLTRP